MRRGSYAQGFAPRDFRPMFPELWRGCMGAYSPCLGPTGLQLFDWAGTGDRGALTNMAADSDWVMSGGAYSLDFDGSNDFVSVPTHSHLDITQNITMTAWIYPTNVSGFKAIGTKGTTSNDEVYGMLLNGSNLYTRLSTVSIGGVQNDTNFTSAGFVATQWQHAAFTYDGATIIGYRNGKQIGSASLAVTMVTINGPLRWGVQGNGTGSPFNGRMDDMRVYNRTLRSNEIALLAHSRGIAYTPARRRVNSAADAGNRRRRVIIGSAA